MIKYFNEDGKQPVDFFLGYEINVESQKMEKYEGSLELKRKILVSVDYGYPNEISNAIKIWKLIVKEMKNEKVVFLYEWQEEIDTSGFSFLLDTSKFSKGKFNVELYQNNKKVSEKTYSFK